MQKKVSFLISFIIVVFLTGCSAEKVNMEEKKKAQEEAQEQQQELINVQKEEIIAETHLKLVEFEDYTPYYCLSFQKIEGGTGNVLLFEGKTELEDQEAIEPINIEIEPYESL